MAAEKKRITLKKKAKRKVEEKEKHMKHGMEEEEVIITIGKPPEEEELVEKPLEVSEGGEEEEIELGEEFEEELEGELEKEVEEEPEEEEIVISIGKPPEVEEEEVEGVEEEEPIEAEVVEEEEVEEEEKEEEEVEEEEKEEKKIALLVGKKLAVIIIAIILVLGSIGIYWFFIRNQDPVAKLYLSHSTATAGELVLMDASNSSDDKKIVEYSWDFGDDTIYSESEESAQDGEFDGKTTHSYEEGNYKVEVTVKDKEGRTGTASTEITITELIVTIPYEMIGDHYTYDVNGSVEVENDEGLYTVSENQTSFTLKKLHIDYEGYMISSVKGTSTKKDGMNESHDTLEKYNYEDLNLYGTASGTLDYSGIETPFDYQINEGYLKVTDRSYIDLTTNKTIFSNVISIFSLPVTSKKTVESNDNLSSYSNLREEPAVLRIEDLSEDRSFAVEDHDTDVVGGIAYTWEVESATNINGYPALGIEIDIDRTTKEKNNIQEFDMWLWIANGVPLPIKTYIYTEIYQDGTTTTVVYNNEIQEDGFERGTSDIPYGTCNANTPDGHYYLRDPDYEFIEWGDGDYIPDVGSNSSSLDGFPPQDAIAYAKGTSTGLSNYLAAHTSAYVTEGYFNDTSGNPPTWNLTFGDRGVDTGYYVVVEDTGSSYNIKEEGEISLPEVMNSTSDLDPILSFSASEQVFESDEDVNENAFDPTGNVRFYDGISYGVKANMIYPSISLTISLTIERTEYGYYLEDEDGTLSAAVDAINGQLMYVWKHEGDDVLSVIMG